MHVSAQVQETIAKLVPGGGRSLSQLSDDELLTSTRRLVGASNKLFAQLLLHLAEVETRGIHRTRACASLYAYCIYELRMSEDAAARRSSAARLVKRFPLLLGAIAGGELHLTGLLMLGPHLTPENHVEVLARAKFRTKKELAKLVRELHPLPWVPDVIEPLGPEPPRSLRDPTWEQWVTSLCPPVRDLRAGESPRDWANDGAEGENLATSGAPGARLSAQGEPESDAGDSRASAGELAPITAPERGELAPITAPARRESPISAPARREMDPITAPQRYQVQFSTTEAHVRLIERAKELLARSSPGVSLGELHLQAMQLLVEKLERARFAVTKRSRKARGTVPSDPTLATPPKRFDSRAAIRCRSGDDLADPTGTPPRQRGGDRTNPTSTPPRQRGATEPAPARTPPRQRGRYIPAAVKREVFARDAGCCSYVDERGRHCAETRYLELHHLKPFARGGENVASNLVLRCAAHNALAAEEDFGRGLIEGKRHAARHEARSAQG